MQVSIDNDELEKKVAISGVVKIFLIISNAG